MRTFVQKPKATQQTTSAKSTIPGRAHLGQSREVSSILHLERTIGNQAVQRLLHAKPDGLEPVSGVTAPGRFGHDFSRIQIHAKASVKIQPKRAASASGDIYEQEADGVSDQVMQMAEPQLKRACACGGGCPKCREEENKFTLQRRAVGNPAVSGLVQSLTKFDGAEVIRRLGGNVHTGVAIDAALHQMGARAATIARRVYLRSDIHASPDLPENRRTFAHETVHLLQQAHAKGAPDCALHDHESVEREAEAGADRLLAGKVPVVTRRDPRPVLRCQFDKEFGPADNIGGLAEARTDPLWVENGIFNYFMESLKSPEIILVYEDGNILRIPLRFVHNKPLDASGGTVTMLRRHRTTGRLVPFAISQAHLFNAGLRRQGQPGNQVLGELVPPRFDPSLTPMIPRIVDAELLRHATIGILEVAKLQVGGALLRGAIQAGAAGGLFTTPRVVAGSITAGANLLDQALTYGSDWNKYNWGSVGFDFVFGMVTQSLVAKLFQRFPAPIFSRKALSLETWRNFGYQQAIFVGYGTMVGLIRSRVGNISPGKAVASQQIEGALQAAKSGAMDTFLKSAVGLEHFPGAKNDVRIIFISKLMDIVIKAAVRQTLDVTPRNEPQNQ